MANENPPVHRVKFLGLGDLGMGYHAERAARLLEHYDPSSTARSVSDVLELHNAQRFAENDVFPSSYTDKQLEAIKAHIPALRKTVGKFFSTIQDASIASVLVDVAHLYHDDLLKLCERQKVYDRCSAAAVLPALEQTGVAVGTMLTNQRLVQCYDQDVRALFIADPHNAECLIRKYLDKDAHYDFYRPASFTDSDARALLDSYLNSDDANPNFVRLVATGKLIAEAGIDAKLKLKAKRKHEAWTEEFFKNNTGMQSGSVLGISDTQTEPVTMSQDGLVAKFSYSRRWLEDSLDFPTILNNFLYLFEFANYHMLLLLPSFQANLGVLERHMGITGKTSYPTGIVFQIRDESAFLQAALYTQFLQTRDIELESVIAWFFAEYLQEEFGAANLKFTPSNKTSSYLEKCRHLFSEMESVIKQFSLFAENGEFDVDLLTITSDAVVYKKISSLLVGKYVYPADDNQDIRAILNLLFSDQSMLNYINEGLRGDDAAQLIIDHQVAYDDFHPYQKPSIDYLIGLGVLENTGARVQIADIKQFRILHTLWRFDAASYYHYSVKSRTCIDDMVAKGWLVRQGSLLTHSEGSYFNYYLNQSEFSDGPALRNKYVHGSQIGGDDRQHFATYITALKLLIALVIKMNDEFWLRDEEGK
jgi:hypothetical protein